MNNLEKRSDESLEQYKLRLCSNKFLYGLTWEEVAELVNYHLIDELRVGSDAYRKWYSKKVQENTDQSLNNEIKQDDNEYDYFEEKEKIKLREERTQINAMLRAIAREDTLKEISLEIVKEMSSKKILDPVKPERLAQLDKQMSKKKSATLCLGDWHYGLEVDLFYNKYNPEVAKERLNNLLEQVLYFCYNEDIYTLTVLNLGDLISGVIHLPLRINSRYDVITQTIHVSEMLSEFLNSLCQHIPQVNFMSVTDNHSRINPNKKESLQIESFARIITWYISDRLKDNENFAYIENAFGDDIATYNTLGHKIIAVHGDKDPQTNIVSRLSTYTQYHADLILTAHKHHFSGDEDNQTITLCNGSLMGVDDYASSLRCNSTPSQLLIVHSKENVIHGIHRMIL